MQSSSILHQTVNYIMVMEGGPCSYASLSKSTVNYYGIRRNKFPKWEGWIYIDEKEYPPIHLVIELYKTEYWDVLDVEDLLVKAMVMENSVATSIDKAYAMYKRLVDPTSIQEYTIYRVTELMNANNKLGDIYLRDDVTRILKTHKWLKETEVSCV